VETSLTPDCLKVLKVLFYMEAGYALRTLSIPSVCENMKVCGCVDSKR
jgi:hypothetical protein